MFDRFSLSRRFWTAASVFWIVFTMAMVSGSYGLMLARDSLNTVHSVRMHTVAQINGMVTRLQDSRMHLLLSFQHDPSSSLYSLHDHPLDAHLNVVRDKINENVEIRKALMSRDMDDVELELFQSAINAQVEWEAYLLQLGAQLARGNFSPALMQGFLVAGRTTGDAVTRAFEVLQEYQHDSANLEAQRAEQRYDLMRLLFALIVLFGALPVTGFMLLTLRRMSRGLQEVNDTARSIAHGDLTRHIIPDGNDEITSLLSQVDAMQQHLRALISRIYASAATISDVSSQVADGSQLLADRTDQQAASLQETSSATEELTSTVQQNAGNAAEVENMAEQATAVARRGGEAVHNVVRTMDEISEASHQISVIVEIIDSIAFQTNILALNAAVEAARAGEQGRGFAVVASEVRALAQRSAAAASEVKDLIDNSVSIVKSGGIQVSDAGETITDIVSNNERMMVLMREIAAATQEQSIGLNQINQAIALMDNMTHQNVTLVERTTQASDTLRSQVNQLIGYVSAFRLDDAPVPKATPVTADASAREGRGGRKAAPALLG